ncbi:hypothetical protein Patl1_08774 [Pistacia atlantica]|uniref:Uncharacterized protein n=1 Tax=Pistacia atlantica TaxID=434234 RepID=A0ACC1ALX4_9ROSI|nr:hypothetical protein Patl1_08774 [Pistacia atlantica]
MLLLGSAAQQSLGDHALHELVYEGNCFTPSDVEMALWSSAIGAKLQASRSAADPEIRTRKSAKRKRKH